MLRSRPLLSGGGWGWEASVQRQSAGGAARRRSHASPVCVCVCGARRGALPRLGLRCLRPAEPGAVHPPPPPSRREGEPRPGAAWRARRKVGSAAFALRRPPFSVPRSPLSLSFRFPFRAPTFPLFPPCPRHAPAGPPRHAGLPLGARAGAPLLRPLGAGLLPLAGHPGPLAGAPDAAAPAALLPLRGRPALRRLLRLRGAEGLRGLVLGLRGAGRPLHLRQHQLLLLDRGHRPGPLRRHRPRLPRLRRLARLLPLGEVSWGVPFGITAAAVALKKIGYDASDVSVGWCWIDISAEDRLLWMLLAGKLWEILAYVTLPVFYVLIKKHINRAHAALSEYRPILSRAPTSHPGAASVADKKLTLIPIIFIFLRVWSTIRFVLTLSGSPADQNWLLVVLHGIGNTFQGAANCILFVFCTRVVRNKLFSSLCCWRYSNPEPPPPSLETSFQAEAPLCKDWELRGSNSTGADTSSP